MQDVGQDKEKEKRNGALRLANLASTSSHP
jgi:hypothetical protein